MGGVSTPEKYGSGKVRGQSVDITTKGPDHSVEVWANFVPNVAERVGFEPTIRLPLYRFSSPILVVLIGFSSPVNFGKYAYVIAMRLSGRLQ